jgi:hypothetical protein
MVPAFTKASFQEETVEFPVVPGQAILELSGIVNRQRKFLNIIKTKSPD